MSNCPACTAQRPRLCDKHYQEDAERFVESVKRAIADPQTPGGIKATYEQLLEENEALHKRLAALPPTMTWTTEVKDEGWYWYRNDGEQPSVVEVYEHPDKGFHMSGPQVTHCCIADLAGDEEFSGSKWCRLEPPQ